MRIEVRIDCSFNEYRRLVGQPDVLPFAELAGEAMARWLQERILAAEFGGDAGEQEVRVRGRHRLDRG